jgi:hypothetical protein
MNKPVPIPLRPDPDANRRAAVTLLVRAAITAAHAVFDKNVHAVDYARKTWGATEARSVELVTRAASAPAMTTTTGWAAELAHVSTQFIASLTPVSAAAALLSRGLQLRFDGLASISLPTITQGQAGWVGQGKPVPVTQYVTAPGVKLEPHKFGLAAVLTREMVESSNAEAAVRAVLTEGAALGLDTALFSANAGTPDSPPGLLYGVAPTTASTASPLSDAMMADLATLGGAIARVAGDDIIFVAAPEQATSLRLWVENLDYPVLASKALAAKTVIAIAPAALVSGFAPLPEIIARTDPALHMDTAPAEIVGTGGAVAQPSVISLFQTDRIGLRMLMPAAWALRASNAIAWMNSTAW